MLNKTSHSCQYALIYKRANSFFLSGRKNCLDYDISNSITLYFVNGDVIVMKLKDLTPQIKTLKKGGEIIVEEFLEIKGPAGGFQPGVGDWNDVEVEIVS